MKRYMPNVRTCSIELNRGKSQKNFKFFPVFSMGIASNNPKSRFGFFSPADETYFAIGSGSWFRN